MDVWKLPHCGILGAAVSFLWKEWGMAMRINELKEPQSEPQKVLQ